MPFIDKETIRKNFSESARYYDLYSDIQDMSARELILRAGEKEARRILDIGCGTGSYTKLLREHFPSAGIKAVDISHGMIELARKKLAHENVEFIVADGEYIRPEGRFDLITSNASLHWFHGLKSALSAYREFLQDDGLLLFSAFGSRTFMELNSSLREFLGRDSAITADGFAKKEEIEDILRSLFKESSAEEVIYKKQYASLLDLLNSIKYTGTKGAGIAKRNFWTPRAMSEIEKIYIKKFKGIEATYQVFFCKGIK